MPIDPIVTDDEEDVYLASPYDDNEEELETDDGSDPGGDVPE